jgi:hypothetical protein
MGLKSMVRQETEQPSQEELDKLAREFIKSSPVVTQPSADAPAKPIKVSKKKPLAKRFIFSLTEEASDQIDAVSLLPRKFKASRSDVIKAGLLALRQMPKSEAIALLAKVTGSETTEGI